MHATVIRLILALSVVLASMAVAPSRSLAGAPSDEHPRAVVLEAGRQVGYRIDPAGNPVAAKTVTLRHASTAHTTRRQAFGGGDVLLRIVDGKLAGYWVRESIAAHVVGVVGSERYSPARPVSVSGGTFIGYRFTSSWKLRDAEIDTVPGTLAPLTDRFAIINGIGYYHLIDGRWAGTWMPAAGELTAKRLRCHTGPPVDATRRVVRTVTGAGPEVALTFDMGGRLDPAVSTMKFLLLNGVCTTVFPTGQSSQTDAGARVLDMIRRYPQVFEVGNHTMWHCNLVSGGEGIHCPTTRPGASRVRRELTEAAAIIEAGTGRTPLPLWRPPYGAYDAGVLDAAASVGYTTTALWDVDTIDWRPTADGGPTAPQIAGRVVDASVGGSVVLMHLGGWHTLEALPSIVHRLRGERDLLPTSLSDLLDRS